MMRIKIVFMMVLVGIATAAAEEAKEPFEVQKPKGTWQQPGSIQEPKGPWTTPGKIEAAKGAWQRPSSIQEPKGPWIKPGEIEAPKGAWQQPSPVQEPKGPWIKPGEIQVPKGVLAVEATEAKCERRIRVVGDALFDFDKSNLRPDAEETLTAAGPELAKLAGRPALIEGHTDAKGSDAYNMKLSEARARSARDWLSAHGFLPGSTPVKGYGKTRPIAPNEAADGRDDPDGRQKNRRVEIVFSTCS
jgi:outer membrane protein OmpA-like peptidoglycan-associated protein